jgi:hypothetical protein
VDDTAKPLWGTKSLPDVQHCTANMCTWIRDRTAFVQDGTLFGYEQKKENCQYRTDYVWEDTCDSAGAQLTEQDGSRRCVWTSKKSRFATDNAPHKFKNLFIRFDLRGNKQLDFATKSGHDWEGTFYSWQQDYMKVELRTCAADDSTDCGQWREAHRQLGQTFHGYWEHDIKSGKLYHAWSKEFLQGDDGYVQARVTMQNDDSNEIHQFDDLEIFGGCQTVFHDNQFAHTDDDGVTTQNAQHSAATEVGIGGGIVTHYPTPFPTPHPDVTTPDL